jgi:hypothetical protein
MLTLFHAHKGRHRFASLVTGAAACTFAVVAAVGTDDIERARFHSGLQKLADDAALAGVNALASEKDALAQEARHQAAFGASKSIIRGSGRTDLQRSIVTLSEGNLKVSVSLSAVEPSPWWHLLGGDKTISVASTAHYMPGEQNGSSAHLPSAGPLALRSRSEQSAGHAPSAASHASKAQ